VKDYALGQGSRQHRAQILPGCFRCHDDEHKTVDGQLAVSASDCNACHRILSQGGPEARLQLAPSGQEFKHPGDDVSGTACNMCHDGSGM
jgi:hypothetical protein